MFSSKAILRSLRSIPRIPTATRPRAPHQPLYRDLPSPILRRFESSFRRYPPPPPQRRPDKIIHQRWDPEHIRNAKPLLTVEGIKRTVTSGTSKLLIVLTIGSVSIFYFTHLEEVPESGRKRFICFTEETMEEQGQYLYQQIIQGEGQAILPEWDARSRMVNRVMDRLIQANGLEHVQWEVNVIHSDQINAFVLPGGKVFVYSGLLRVARTDDQLATVLGHEIAHNLARHPAEQLSRSVFMILPLQTLAYFLDSAGFTFGVGQLISRLLLDLGVARPASRVQESEADYIGLMVMARSCYNPQAAVEVWNRMEEANKNEIPEWLSTHPSNVNRASRITEWLTKAEDARESSDCAVTLGYQRQFKDTLGQLRGFYDS